MVAILKIFNMLFDFSIVAYIILYVLMRSD